MVPNKRVSIIMPTLNAEKTILTAIFAIKNQSYKDIQTVIIDGGSSDRTLELVREILPVAEIYSQNSRGIWGAINEGIMHSDGEFIFSLNADDYISPKAIEALVDFAITNTYDCVWLPTYSCGGYKTFIKLNHRWLGIDRVTTGHSAAFMIKKSVQIKIGFYDPKVSYCADHELFNRIFRRRLKVGVMPPSRDAFGVFTAGGFSSTNRYLDKVREEAKFRFSDHQGDFHDLIFLCFTYPLKLIWSIKFHVRQMLFKY